MVLPPILDHKNASSPSVFVPSALLREARRQKNVPLVAQEKNGRTVTCRAQYHRMDAVIEFLREHCCEGFESDLPAAATRRTG